ncbi:DHA2 family efflux MFS transporter permease subunit [Nocardia farcinica]|uniref:DHA2 family efflux MFS transporter permease subunit n=2 Tax=Nocardia farcinica TaxID=37329 RepID=UPI0015F08021|nr:DHA2 family efflux MFS transporter permease subunit [Nocardia farcinica]MBA4854161.1 DHA2 family efflux MFS transporter permease subunit [Nocardia farcinica]MBC9814346.1 DHA2 family efflux MFS transporter permease subunit [Nocardia farcinica]
MAFDQQAPAPARTSAELSAEPVPRRTWVVIGMLLVASFVVILNETIMSVALPSLMADFRITAATAQWVTTGFLLTMAVVIPTTGVVLQRFGTRAVFVAAMSLFTAGTGVAAAAPAFAALLTGRVLQAAGTAVMLPLLTTTVLSSIPAARRGRTVGMIAVVIAVAPAVGPTISGLVLASLDWRWLFLITVPVAGTILALGAALVRDIGTTRRVRVDLASLALSALAFGGLVFGLSSIGEAAEGSAPVPVAVPLAAGLVALGLFVARQLRLQTADAALMDLRPLRAPTFVVGAVVLLICMAALFGTLILLPIFLQSVLGMSTLQTGLLLLPGGLVMGALAPVVGRVYDRFGARPVVAPGAVVLTAGLATMATFDQTSSAPLIIAAHVVLSAGLALVITPAMTAALSSLDPALYSHGSAIVNTLQQLAGAAGTAVFVSLMTRVSADRVAAGADRIGAVADGIRFAFLCGAGLAGTAVVVALRLRPAPIERPGVNPG